MKVSKKVKGHLKSRKFTFALIGTLAVFLVFGISLASMVTCPAICPQIVNLANIAIVFLGSVTGVMVGGQSFVDWKHGSGSQFSSNDIHDAETLNENETYTEKIERPRDYDDGSVS
jgi:hypothetical protein